MATYTVGTAAELVKYAASSVNGDTILLKAGTYNAVSISNIVKSGNVTISSADSSHPAVLTSLSVNGSAGLTFSGLEMVGSRDLPFSVYGSSRIVLDKLDVHGSLDGNPNDDNRGMIVRNSTDVTVSNSHFREFTDALTHINSQNLTFVNNTFDTLADNGIVGGGSSDVLVANNSFTNFVHTSGVHPDAIQFWTTNTTASVSDITVTGNVFDRGTGSAIQGIWISDEVGNLPYSNVTVSNNVVLGALYNGIVVGNATNATLSGNVVIGTDDQPSWIGVRSVDNATITDNLASSYNFADSNVTSSGDVQTTTMADATSASPDASAPSLIVASSSSDVHAPATIDAAAGVAYAGVSLLGFIDGQSTIGRTYHFTEITVNGTSGADRLSAGAVGTSHLYGLDGNDTLTGGRNGISSTLEGGRGDDTYTIYQPQDAIVERAGEGTDTVATYVNYTLGANIENARAMSAGLTLHGNEANNSLVAHASGSILYGEAGDDVFTGGAGNDQMYGGLGNDRVSAGDGADIFDGGAGNDTLSGGAGGDTILGGDGNDQLEGGAGLDTLSGGTGADTFVFRAGDFSGTDLASVKDVITDFKASEGDIIGLSTIDANTNTTASDAFSFIGSQAFHGVAGELCYTAEGDGITVYGDTNGDKIADLAIHLTGVTTITSSSFYL